MASNKRIQRKRAKANGFYQRVQTDNGPVVAHVNRRGCTGAWTQKNADMLDQLVRAVHRQFARTPSLEKTDNG